MSPPKAEIGVSCETDTYGAALVVSAAPAVTVTSPRFWLSGWVASGVKVAVRAT